MLDKQYSHEDYEHTLSYTEIMLAERSIQLKYGEFVMFVDDGPAILCHKDYVKLVRQRVCVECHEIITDSKLRRVPSKLLDLAGSVVDFDVDLDNICAKCERCHFYLDSNIYLK